MDFCSFLCVCVRAVATAICVSYSLVVIFGQNLPKGKLCLFQHVSPGIRSPWAWNADAAPCCAHPLPRHRAGTGSGRSLSHCYEVTSSSIQGPVVPIAAANGNWTLLAALLLDVCCTSLLLQQLVLPAPLIPSILGTDRVQGEWSGWGRYLQPRVWL